MEDLPSELKNVVQFHGHLCPGLVLGYRVAILAKKELDLRRSEDEELVAIVENDSCAVDAIQYINGATFGKGNLVFQDHGLHAYTFIERNSGKQIRIELKADVFNDASDQRHKILKKLNEDIPLTEEEKTILQQSRQELLKKILKSPDKELFDVKKIKIEVPEKARVFHSVQCSKCGLMVMETRARVLNQKFYCIPCWESELEKK
ncbi:MAG: TraR/DksA C4-type zinc finger protein [Candidatus Helarchaeota archaeon]|nr:TraR/DksA C4-type zinc finger protein [Candidatus Helarchaeota archaeon]